LKVLPSNEQVLSIERLEALPEPPKIERVERAGDLLRLYFNAEAGLPYAVEYRDSAGSDSWQALTNISALPAPAVIEVSDGITGHPQRFYRLSTPAEMPAAAPRINLHFTAQPGVSYAV